MSKPGPNKKMNTSPRPKNKLQLLKEAKEVAEIAEQNAIKNVVNLLGELPPLPANNDAQVVVRQSAEIADLQEHVFANAPLYGTANAEKLQAYLLIDLNQASSNQEKLISAVLAAVAQQKQRVELEKKATEEAQLIANRSSSSSSSTNSSIDSTLGKEEEEYPLFGDSFSSNSNNLNSHSKKRRFSELTIEPIESDSDDQVIKSDSDDLVVDDKIEFPMHGPENSFLNIVSTMARRFLNTTVEFLSNHNRLTGATTGALYGAASVARNISTPTDIPANVLAVLMPAAVGATLTYTPALASNTCKAVKDGYDKCFKRRAVGQGDTPQRQDVEQINTQPRL